MMMIIHQNHRREKKSLKFQLEFFFFGKLKPEKNNNKTIRAKIFEKEFLTKAKKSESQ